MSIVRLLRAARYEAIWVTNSRDALELLRAYTPALIILDVHLPGVSGLTLLGKIKKDDRLRPVPVIMYSAADDEEAKREARQLGAADFVLKFADGCDILLKHITDTCDIELP